MIWNEGTIKYVCEKCRKELARETGEILNATGVELYVTCKNCLTPEV